jgi:hypothetical protein
MLESIAETPANVRTARIVFRSPSLDALAGLRQIAEPVSLETLRPQGFIEALYVRIVRRLPRPGEVDFHLVVIRPQIHHLVNSLPFVAEQNLRCSALLLQHADEPGTGGRR